MLTSTYNAAAETLEVTIYNPSTMRTEKRTFKAFAIGTGAYAFNVLSGKFRMGTKLWPVPVFHNTSTGKTTLGNAGHSNKGGVMNVVGWYELDSKHNSKSY